MRALGNTSITRINTTGYIGLTVPHVNKNFP